MDLRSRFQPALKISALMTLSALALPSFAAYQLPNGDLKNAMTQTLSSATHNYLNKNADTIRYELNSFKVDLTCLNGWTDVSGDYTISGTYYSCEGPVKMDPAAGDLDGIIATTVNTNQMIVSDNGQFFGEFNAVPNLPFGGANWLTDNMSGSRIAFAVAKGAILNDYADIEVGLPDNRIMAFFDVSYTDGGSLALTDSIEASAGSNSFSLKFVLDWKDPLYYFETDLFTKGPFEASPVKLTAQGLSYHGRLGFEANYPLYNGSSWSGAEWNNGRWEISDTFDEDKFTQDGHLVIGGEIEFQPYPITLSGLFNVDFDQADDGFNSGGSILDSIGKSLMEVASDTALAGNGTLSVDLGEYAGIELSMDIGEGSTNFNSSKKSFSYWAESVNPFSGGVANKIFKLVKGINVPKFVSYGHIDIDNTKVKSFEQYFSADINHNGFLLKGDQSITYGVQNIADGFMMDGTVGYKGAPLSFSLHATSNSCNTSIDTSSVVNVGGYSLGNVSLDLCKIADNALVQLTGYVTVAGKQVQVIGQTAWNQTNTLASAANQTFNLTNGKIQNATVELKESGMQVKNAVAKFGNKAKSFNMSNIGHSVANGFSRTFSGFINKNGLDTGNFSVGSPGVIAWTTVKVYGDGKYRGRVNGNSVGSEHVTNLKVKYCAKVKVGGIKKQKCNTDSIATISEDLDLNGCFKTPSMNKSFKLLGVKVKFPIPRKTLCMF